MCIRDRTCSKQDGGPVLLLTGATGAIGSRLLPLLLEGEEPVRCLVREPRRLGEHRVDVQITMGDLSEMADPYRLRQSMRGVDTVIHLAATCLLYTSPSPRDRTRSRMPS